MSRICLTCGYREVVDEVEPIVLHSNPGYFYVMLILLCYARRRGLVSVSMADVSIVN